MKELIGEGHRVGAHLLERRRDFTGPAGDACVVEQDHHEAQRRRNPLVVERSQPSRRGRVRASKIEPDDLKEQQLRKLLRRQHRTRTIRGHLFYELVLVVPT
jgi:hypothetical protein